MEKKIIKVPVKKEIISSYKTETVYIAQDGRQFPANQKKYAEDYDNCLMLQKKFEKIKTIEVKLVEMLYNFPSKWYYASNEEELSLIIGSFGGKNQAYTVVEIYDTLDIEKWIGYYIDDSDDYRRYIYVYTLNDVLEKLKNFSSEIFKKTNGIGKI